MEQIKVLKLKSRVCWVIFIIAQSILIGLMIATLVLPHWVKLEPKSSPQYNFQGSLFKVTEGLTAIPNPLNPLSTANVNDYSYITLGCSTQYILDVSVQSTSPTAFWDFYTSWAAMFNDLWFAGGLYLVFELSSLVSLSIIIVSLVLLFWNKFYFNLNLCATFCAFASHIIAIVGWITYLDISFQDNSCSELYSGTNPPTLCAQDGPKLGLLVLFILPVILIPYTTVLVLFKKQADRVKVHEFDQGIDEINTTRTNGPRGITKEDY